MVKRIGNAVTFFVLAGLLLLNGTSRNFIHDFTGHKDTVDHLYPGNALDHHEAFEPIHHHCAFLHFVVPVYHPTEEIFQIALIQQEPSSFPEQKLVWFSEERSPTFLRGPPSAYSFPKFFI